jgi:glycosyltransferase involved in cell wall biosynthesis
MRYVAVANRFPTRYVHNIIAMDGATCARGRLHPAVRASFPAQEAHKSDTLGNYRRFRTTLRTTRPDCLVTHNWGSIEWAMANWPRLAHHIHIEDGFGPEEQTNQIRRRVLTRRIVLSRTTVVVPSRNLQRIATTVWGLSPRRVYYLPNGIDLARFTPRRQQPNGPLVVGTVAALRPEKNLPRLLRAFALAHATTPASLIIAGDGPERATLERLADELRISPHVRFLGYVPDPSSIYHQVDIFALSSDTEQMPISVMEAMASGLPVVSTDVGDVRQMLSTPNLPLVTADSDQALAATLITALRDSTLRRTIGAQNRAKAEQDYGQEAMFQAYAALFDGIS